MSHCPQFTPEEEAEFKDLEFRRSRADELYYFDRGVPRNARHKQWLEEQKRQKAQQDACAAAQKYAQNTRQYPQTYANGGPADSYADPEYQNSDPSESATSIAAYSGYGTANSQRDEQPNEIAAPKILENVMSKVCDCFATMRTFSPIIQAQETKLGT